MVNVVHIFVFEANEKLPTVEEEIWCLLWLDSIEAREVPLPRWPSTSDLSDPGLFYCNRLTPSKAKDASVNRRRWSWRAIRLLQTSSESLAVKGSVLKGLQRASQLALSPTRWHILDRFPMEVNALVLPAREYIEESWWAPGTFEARVLYLWPATSLYYQLLDCWSRLLWHVQEFPTYIEHSNHVIGRHMHAGQASNTISFH